MKLLALLIALLCLTSCRVPGVDQHENNHKVIQVWEEPKQ